MQAILENPTESVADAVPRPNITRMDGDICDVQPIENQVDADLLDPLFEK